ncbi:MAG: RNA polymerase sigma factor [Firmicutes bacterium]|nr:RNA polymerase sigma factor [Bacillota bacterium]
MEENKLIELAIAGDKDAFCGLYGQYKDRLYRYAYYRLKDSAAAEDAVSDCVLSAWKSIGRLRSPGAFSSWIFRILQTVCSGRIRKIIEEREFLETVTGTEQEASPDPSDSVFLKEALDLLPDEDRDMVLLSVVAGLTSQEIGDLYEMPAGTVRSRLSRSLGKLRSFLEGSDHE